MTRMTQSPLGKALIAAAMLAAPSAALAVPAYPGLIKFTQPDGTSVTIRLEGDEFNHRTFSEDGYLLMADQTGAYTYARLCADGSLAPSEFKAVEKSARSAATNSFLASINTTEILKASEKSMELNTAANVERMQKIRKEPGQTQNPGLTPSSFPPFGDPKAIVILVEYEDVKFGDKVSDKITDYIPGDYFTRMINEEGFSDYEATGSCRDWFIYNSNGLFMPQFDVYGPVTLPQKMKYYGGNDINKNDRRPWDMVTDACDLLDEEVDFSQYDSDGDGKVDNIFVFYAGFGEADGGGNDTVWPHSYDLSYAYPSKKFIYDDVQVDHYACSNEIDHQTRRPDGIGTFVHEFSHVLGLPDLYATSYTSAFTPGAFSPLDQGPYNNEGRTPPNYSSFERFALGWMEPIKWETEYTASLNPDEPENPEDPEDPQDPEKEGEQGDDEPEVTVQAYTLPNMTDENVAFIAWASDKEYFLFENRQQTGNDTYIPGHGMLIWHVDFDEKVWLYNQVNNNASHQYVDLIEADNSKTDGSRKGDPFPGKKNVSRYAEDSKPAFKSWAKKPLGINLENIAESEDGIITFDLHSKVAGNTNAVESITGSRASWSIQGRTITCAETTAVYDIAGRRIAQIAAGDATTLPAGLYIVKSSSRAAKVIVR